MLNPKAEIQESKGDAFKLALALLLVTGAMAAFYFYSDQSLLLRVVGLLAVGGVAGALALHTAQGRDIWGFFKEAQIEVRKVVWPTRQETTRMTLIVIAMVIAMAAILWLLDALLAWLVQWLTGTRG